MAANDILAKVSVIINAQTAELGKDLKGAQSQINSFSSNISKLGKTIAGAFAVREIANFTLDISKLAGELKGVKSGFDLLPNSVKVLEDLKDATGDTVSELELMKRTVQAANFGISLSALPKLLEFATLRAQQTGQSVDYLVDSIVTGIGRKSPLILDNLGISAVALKENLNGVSTAAASVGQVAEAVGRIAEENLKSMAGFSENAQTKIEQLSAAWQDFKAQLGTRANEGGLFLVDIPLASLQALVDLIKTANSDPVMESFNNQTAIAVDNFKKLDQAAQTDAINRLAQDIQAAKNDLEAFNKEIESGVNRDNLSVEETLLQLELMSKGIISLQDQYRKFINLYKSVNDGNTESIGIVQGLESRIKSLGESIKEATSIGSIRNFQKELERVKSQLNDILKPPSAPVNIPVEFNLDFDYDAFKNIEIPPVIVDVEIGEESTEAADKVIENIKRIRDEAKQLAAEFSNVVRNGLQNVLVGFAEDLGRAAVGVGNFGEGILQAVAGFAKQFGALLISAGLAKIAFEKLAISGVGAVVAGVALIAAASAVSAHVSKSSKALSGVGGSSFSGSSVGGGYRSSSSLGSINQNSSPITFQIKGEDLWGTLNNYNRNSRYTNATNG